MGIKSSFFRNYLGLNRPMYFESSYKHPRSNLPKESNSSTHQQSAFPWLPACHICDMCHHHDTGGIRLNYRCIFGSGLVDWPEARKNMVQIWYDPKYFSADPCLGWGRDPRAGTCTTYLRHTRNGLYKDTKRPIYLLKLHFILYFYVLDKRPTKLEMMLVRCFIALK